MRTSLRLDVDIADALRERARLLNKSFEQVLNDTLRRGMSREPNETPSGEYRVSPNHSALAPGIDPLKLNQLNDHLDAEGFAAPAES